MEKIILFFTDLWKQIVKWDHSCKISHSDKYILSKNNLNDLWHKNKICSSLDFYFNALPLGIFKTSKAFTVLPLTELFSVFNKSRFWKACLRTSSDLYSKGMFSYRKVWDFHRGKCVQSGFAWDVCLVITVWCAPFQSRLGTDCKGKKYIIYSQISD